MQETITILVTSDTHGQWVDRHDQGGRSLRDTAEKISQVNAEADHPVLTIDLGDFIQGSTLATYLQKTRDGSFFARVMNAIGYDYQIIGNHEFNFGADYRDHILAQLKAKVLSANIVDAKTLEPVYGQPYDIIEIQGIRIGIIGVTTSYIKNWELPRNYQGLDFLDAFTTTQKYVEYLRPQVDIVIVAYHGGVEKDLTTFEAIEPQTGENQGARMLQEIPGIDVLLTGHQHRLIAEVVGDTVVIQPGFGGESLGQVDLVFEGKTIVDKRVVLHPVTKGARHNPAIEAAMAPDFQAVQEWLGRVIGRADLAAPTTDAFLARMQGHPFAEFLNQLQLRETGAQYSGVAIVNDAFKDFIGPITNEKLLLSYPFFNLIATVELTGQDLKAIMEFNLRYFILNKAGQVRVNPRRLHPKPQHYNYDLYSGFKTLVDLTQPFGNRVIAMIDEATGDSLKADETYRVAVSQYRSVGGGHFHWFTPEKVKAISRIDIAKLMYQALENFTPADWQAINQHYRHLDFIPEVPIAPSPMSLVEEAE